MSSLTKCIVFILSLALHQHHLVDGSKPADAIAGAVTAAVPSHHNISNVDNRRSGKLDGILNLHVTL